MVCILFELAIFTTWYLKGKNLPHWNYLSIF